MATQVGKVHYNSRIIVGEGSYGTIVFRGFLGLYENDKSVAVKRIQRGKGKETFIKQEVELLKKASDHSNILRFIRTEIDTNFL